MKRTITILTLIAALLVGFPPPASQQAATPPSHIASATSITTPRLAKVGRVYRDPMPTYLMLGAMIPLWTLGLLRITRRGRWEV